MEARCLLVVISEIEWISLEDRSDVEDYNYGKIMGEILPNEFLIGYMDKQQKTKWAFGVLEWIVVVSRRIILNSGTLCYL